MGLESLKGMRGTRLALIKWHCKVNKLRYPRLILQTDLEVKPWRGIFLKGIQRYILERSSVRQWL